MGVPGYRNQGILSAKKKVSFQRSTQVNYPFLFLNLRALQVIRAAASALALLILECVPVHTHTHTLSHTHSHSYPLHIHTHIVSHTLTDSSPEHSRLQSSLGAAPVVCGVRCEVSLTRRRGSQT